MYVEVKCHEYAVGPFSRSESLFYEIIICPLTKVEMAELELLIRSKWGYTRVE